MLFPDWHVFRLRIFFFLCHFVQSADMCLRNFAARMLERTIRRLLRNVACCSEGSTCSWQDCSICDADSVVLTRKSTLLMEYVQWVMPVSSWRSRLCRPGTRTEPESLSVAVDVTVSVLNGSRSMSSLCGTDTLYPTIPTSYMHSRHNILIYVEQREVLIKFGKLSQPPASGHWVITASKCLHGRQLFLQSMQSHDGMSLLSSLRM